MVDVLNCEYMLRYAKGEKQEKAFFIEPLEILKFIGENKITEFEVIDFTELPF